MEDRKLSDADVEAIATEMEKRMVSRFYRNLGSGVWALAWKAVVVAIIGIAVVGAIKTGHVPPPR